ncbi:MAG: carbon starvation protein A [Myxococcales bacterium]|nr:carbon starvation protein A [Myxococcales bacterium]
MAALAALVVLALFALGYRFYARYVGRRVFGDDERVAMPSETRADGRDFVATDRHILFGHHFTSIAGAAPIVGPCVAAYWGWLPALVWVCLGTIFLGAVHDFGALVTSAREGGRSIGDVAAQVLGPRARILFLCFVLVLVWLVLAVFAMVIAGLFVSEPASVLPVQAEIPMAMVAGWLIHRRKIRPLLPSLVVLVALYTLVWVGTLAPFDLPALTGCEPAAAKRAWIAFLFVYAAFASLLPVWLLLQPRDFVNSHQLFVGLAALFLGLFVAWPAFDAPAVRLGGDDAPSIVPLLFVTVACGAISGFHGLVSSGTTSKQLGHLRDARFVGYGAMLGEGTLALASTLAAVSGIALVGACTLPAQGAVADLSWATYYDRWAHAGANQASAFVLGGGAFLEQLGLPTTLARTVMAVLVISFAATTLDTAARIQRFIVTELGEAVGAKALTRPLVATAIALLPAVALALGQTTDPSGQSRELGWVLWPLFGASNQLLAALSLVVMALYFAVRRRPVLPLVIPMVVVTIASVLALLEKLRQFLREESWGLATFAAALLALTLWMLALAARATRRPGT